MLSLRINYQCLWGVSLDNFKENCVQEHTQRKNIICLSSSESYAIKEKLKEHNFHLVEASGAGYKLLTVITGIMIIIIIVITI